MTRESYEERQRLLLTYFPSICLSLEFRFDAMLCFNLTEEYSDAGRIK